MDEYEVKITVWEDNNNYDEDNVNSRNLYNQFRRELNYNTYGDPNSESYNPEIYNKNLKEFEEFDNKTHEIRIDNEKTFWERQKELTEEAYNERLEQLEAEREAEEKINELHEARLQLVKDRISLEEAKKNKSQLVFADGTHYYDVDQEAVASAYDAVNKSEKQISDIEAENEKKAIEEERDNVLSSYDTIIDAIDNLTEDNPITESDTEILAEALQEYAADGKISQEEINAVEDQLLRDISKGSLNMTPDELRNLLESLPTEYESFNVVGEPTIQDKIADTANNIYQNSTVNDQSVHVGDIHMTVQGTNDKELLVSFASQLAQEISSFTTQKMI